MATYRNYQVRRGLTPTGQVRGINGSPIGSVANAVHIVQWDVGSFEENTPSFFSMTSPSEMTCQIDGWIEVTALVAYVTNISRWNGRFSIEHNGAARPPRGKGGYVRAASGHNESSLHVSDIFRVSAGDLVRLVVERESTSGTVRQTANQSFFRAAYIGGQ